MRQAACCQGCSYTNHRYILKALGHVLNKSRCGSSRRGEMFAVLQALKILLHAWHIAASCMPDDCCCLCRCPCSACCRNDPNGQQNARVMNTLLRMMLPQRLRLMRTAAGGVHLYITITWQGAACCIPGGPAPAPEAAGCRTGRSPVYNKYIARSRWCCNHSAICWNGEALIG